MKTVVRSLSLGAAALLLTAGRASAEGIRVYGVSPEAQVRAEAVVASGSDAGTNWYNPARLVELGKPGMALNMDNLFVNATYVNPLGHAESDRRRHFLVPAFYAATPFAKGRWALGLGVNSPFGVATAYDNDSPFRYITTGGEVLLTAVNPNVAWKATDKLSLALGANYYQSQAELNQQYRWAAVVPGSPDGSMKIKGEGSGWGVNTALSWKPREGHAFGLSYRSQVVVTLEGKNTEIANVPAPLQPLFGTTFRTGGKTTLRFPDIVNVGYAIRPSNQWLVEFGGHWVNWTDFDRANFDFESNPAFLPDNTLPIYWKNAFALRVGFDFKKSETLSVGGGYFFDKTPTRESTYSPLIPDSDHHMFTTGLRWRKGAFEVSPAVAYLYTPRQRVTSERTDAFGQGQTTSGTYELHGYKADLGVTYSF